MPNLAQKIMDRNKKISRSYAGTKRYWMRSPSNILLYDQTHYALKNFKNGKKVLDAGAGKLAYREILKGYFSEYVSSDFAKTHAELDVITDIEKMSFADKSFDTVFCSQVLEHVPHPWLALKELHRVLKKNGVAIITVPLLGYIHNAPYDFYRYTEYGLRTLSEEAGFEVLLIKPVGGFFSFLGYVRSTFIMPLFGIPLAGTLLLYLNYAMSHIDINLDKLTGNQRIFPLNYLVVLKKSQ